MKTITGPCVEKTLYTHPSNGLVVTAEWQVHSPLLPSFVLRLRANGKFAFPDDGRVHHLLALKSPVLTTTTLPDFREAADPAVIDHTLEAMRLLVESLPLAACRPVKE